MMVDLMAAVLIFLLLGGGITWIWTNKTIEAEKRLLEQEMRIMAEKSLDTLIKSSGSPSNWEKAGQLDVNSIGLSKRDRVLNEEKTSQFIWRSGRLTDNLMGEWHFNSSTEDGSGNYNNAAFLVGGGNYVDGLWKTQGRTFNGAAYLEVDEQSGFDFGFNDNETSAQLVLGYQHTGTVSVWFKTGNIAAQTLVSRRGTVGLRGWHLSASSSEACFHVFTSVEEKKTCYTGSDITDGQWHHLVGTWDSQWMKTYFDGDLKAEYEFTEPGETYNPGIQKVWIGKNQKITDPAGPFAGDLEEIRIYDTALDQSEIRALQEWDKAFVRQKLLIGSTDYYFRLINPEDDSIVKNKKGDLLWSGEEPIGDNKMKVSVRRPVTFKEVATIAEFTLYRDR